MQFTESVCADTDFLADQVLAMTFVTLLYKLLLNHYIKVSVYGLWPYATSYVLIDKFMA